MKRPNARSLLRRSVLTDGVVQQRTLRVARVVELAWHPLVHPCADASAFALDVLRRAWGSASPSVLAWAGCPTILRLYPAMCIYDAVSWQTNKQTTNS